jgi:hypothetical protein
MPNGAKGAGEVKYVLGSTPGQKRQRRNRFRSAPELELGAPVCSRALMRCRALALGRLGLCTLGGEMTQLARNACRSVDKCMHDGVFFSCRCPAELRN